MAIATGASQEIEDEAGQHWRERAAHMRALSLMMSVSERNVHSPSLSAHMLQRSTLPSATHADNDGLLHERLRHYLCSPHPE